MSVVVVVAAAAVIVGYLVPGTAETDKVTDRMFLENTAGPVLFDHQEHNQMTGSCAVCHHPLYSAAQATTCEDCHGDDRAADDFSHDELKEMHANDCSQCHEQQSEAAQAASCRQCHPAIQQSESATLACTECHEDGYTPDIMAHDEYQEIEDHSCLGCHAPQSLSDAYHTGCSDCHLENSPERFTQADGEILCAACHLP